MKIFSFNLKLATLVAISLSNLHGYSAEFHDDDFNYETLSYKNNAVTIKSLNPTSSLKNTLTIPDQISFNDKNYTVEELNDNLFKGNQHLERITLSSKLTKIGDHAFENCTKLSKVALPLSLKSIGEAAFMNCTALEQAEFDNQILHADNLVEIQKNAFSGCLNLESFVINKSNLSLLGEKAFWGCKKMRRVYIRTCKLLGIGEQSFAACTSIEKATFVSDGQKDEKNALILASAFENCSKLKEVNFGVNDLILNDNTIFNGCINLSNLTLPSSIKLLNGNNPFYHLVALNGITLRTGNPQSDESKFEFGWIKGTTTIKAEREIYKTVILTINSDININNLPKPWSNFQQIKTDAGTYYYIIKTNNAISESIPDGSVTVPTQPIISFGGRQFIKNIAK